ncbi:MAG: hypothetical protein J0M20_06570 [Burkholderiales bacterium]|nr:hypothetical protein [Burkholderiales bacterium]
MIQASFASVLRAALVGLAVAGAASGALADAANPLSGTTATVKRNTDGTTTVSLQGNWWWAGQRCTGRYGVGWSVDWWGVSSSQTPVPNFTLPSATQVKAHGVTTTGPVSFAGSIAIPGGTYFHLGSYYSGELAFSPDTCSNAHMGGKSGITGAWSASATYPAGAMIPPQLCVNMYDPHGRAGKPSDKAADLNPRTQKDNSIQTNTYAPGGGSCVTVVVTPPPVP